MSLKSHKSPLRLPSCPNCPHSTCGGMEFILSSTDVGGQPRQGGALHCQGELGGGAGGKVRGRYLIAATFDKSPTC